MPPATAATTSRLAEVPLFSSLSKRDLQRVVSASDQVTYKGGRTIVEQGRPGHEFFLILDGRAIVRRNGRKVATLGPGQYFGELAPLSKGPRDATVVADSDMQLLVIGQRELLAVLEDVPAITLKLLRNLAARLRAVESSV